MESTNTITEITQDKAYEGYQKLLSEDKELLKKEQTVFEKAFGKDQNRTVKQWCNLVRVYGIECVSLHERMTEEEIKLKCMSLTKRLNHISRLRNTIK